MAFDINTKANISFKQIKAKAHTSNNRDPVNEPFVTRPLITSRDIWADSITSSMSLATALSEGIIGSTTQVSLELEPVSGTNDVSSSYSAYTLLVPGTVPAGLSGKTNPLTGAEFAPGDRVSNIILEAYSNDNFRLHLYQDAGKTIEVTTLDACDWTIDPVAGILVQETDVVGSMRNLSNGVLDCFVYVGDTAASATATAGSTTLDLAYEQGNIINADAVNGDFDLRLDGASLKVSNAAGTTPYFTASASMVDVDVDLKVNGLKDEFVSTAIPFSQTGVSGLGATFTATSLVGAINELKTDGSDLLTDLADTADSSSGADMIGVTGITGVIPTGGTVGSVGTVQSMLEGVAMGAGGGKTFADIAAFTTAKAAATYFKLNEPVFILDKNRWVIVKAIGTGVVEETDWYYPAANDHAIKGDFFQIDTATTQIGQTSNSQNISMNAQGYIGMTGYHLGSIQINSTGISSVAYTGKKNTLTSDTELELNGGALVDVNATSVTIDGEVVVTGAAQDDFTVTTTGTTGAILLNSEAQVDLNAPLIDIHGNVVIVANKMLSVDKINITSVDPTDTATITGQRTGIPFTGNLLVNPGFEAGSGANADSWTEGLNSGRDATEKYYDNYSYGYEKSSEVGGVVPVLTQAITGLALSNHVVSVWFKGVAQSPVQVVVNGSSAVTVVPAATTAAVWTRYYADVTPGSAAGDFVIQVLGTAADNNKFYLDALQLEPKAASSEPTGYFSTYQSELILRIGNNAEDKISFQSQAPAGGTIKELVAIDNTQVRIYGDLVVDGATTSVNSATLTIEDNFVLLNSGLTGNPDTNMPDAKAGIEVERGDADNVAIKWNETTNKWELTNDGTTYNTIVTASGAGALSMDVAYDGGSAVTVDDTNVSFTMSAAKSFTIADGTDASKFVVKAGSDADSVKIDTTGGVDIDVDGGFRIDENSGAYININSSGAVSIAAADAQDLTLNTSGSGGFVANTASSVVLNSSGSAYYAIQLNATNGGVDINANGGVDISAAATKPITMDSGSFSIDGVLASNVSVTGADLTLSTITSGALALASAGALTLKDSILTAALPLAQTNAAALATEFAYISQTDFDWSVRDTGTAAITSIVGALNANRQDLYEYVELLSTKGAAVGTAAGANLIGVDGIIGVMPTGKNVGADANLQEMLEGLAKSAGGVKTYANIAAFTADKAAASYLPVDTMVFLKDINRFAIVKVAGTAVVEAVDWDYLWDVSNPMGGAAFTVESSSVDVDSAGLVALDGATGVTLDSAAGISLDAAAASNFTATGANLTLSTATSGNVVITAATTVDIDGAAVDIDSSGAIYLTSGTGNVEIGAGTNQVQLSGSEVDLTATTIDVNGILDVAGASAKIDVTGAIDIDAANGITINDDSGSFINIDPSGVIDISSYSTMGIGSSTGMTEVQGATNLNLRALASVDNSIKISTANGGIDIDAKNTKPITMDSGSFSIDGVLASNVSVTGAALTLSTITSGDLDVTSAGSLTLKDSNLTAGITLSQSGTAALSNKFLTATSIVGALNEVMAAADSANTFDEIYDGDYTTSQLRLVTVDDGSVEWQMTDTYEFNVADSAGADILSVKALSAGDKVDIVAALDVTGDSTLDKTTVAGNLAQSGGTVILSSNGVMDLDAVGAYTLDAAGISLDSTVASNFTVAGAALTLSTTGSYDVIITAGSKVDIGGASLDIDTTGAFSIDGAAASNVSVTGASLTLSTITSGDLAIASAAALTIDSVGAFSIDGAVTASNVSVTGAALTLSTLTSGNLNLVSAGELNLQDSRTAAIPFSQAGITGLPGDATSILGALKVAYENSIDIGYEEKTATSTDVTNDYIVLSSDAAALLPTATSGGPSVMRAAGYHIGAYLNGLRLGDTEWTYAYDSGSSEKRLRFNGSSDITLVSGDLIMVEVRKIN